MHCSRFEGRKLLGEVAMNILEYLSVSDLHAAEKVSLDWSQAVFNGKLWEKHFKRNVSYFVKSLLLHFEKQYLKIISIL